MVKATTTDKAQVQATIQIMIEKGDEEMKKSETKMKYIDNGMIKAMRMVACCLLFFALAGNAWAQGNDGQYVIKKTIYKKVVDNPGPPETYHYVFDESDQHYLAHVKNGDGVWVLQDATEFSPNCLWYSGREYNLMGTNHNYYFIDDENNVRFLMAPLASGGTLSLSSEMPPVYLLNNTDHNYYFYDWDYDNRPNGAGVARGHQYNGITSRTECQACAGGQWNEGNEECWAVYWVECNGTTWSLSTVSQYNITENSGRFRTVTVTPYPLVVESPANGGLADLGSFAMEYPNSQTLSATITPFRYIPAYNKYDFDEVTVPAVPANPEANPPVDYVPPTITHHTYFYPNDGSNTSAPTDSISSTDWTYNWSITGAGAEYLSFSNTGTDMVHSSTEATPTLYYRIENTTGHKTATLTLTVTYQDGSTQTTSCLITVKTPCQNPSFSASVNYESVTISWTQTAESYVVSWKKTDATEWASHEVSSGDITSYPITGLEYETTYDYKVKATSCSSAEPDSLQFTTLHQPTAVIGGAVFGGGRMANVGGKTEVVIINTDSIGAVYGGNDIAGEVLGTAGSTIKLGVTSDDPDAGTYNNGAASTKVRIGDVYGGGNGYYAYDGSSFVPADAGHTSFDVSNGGTVNAMTQSHQLGEVVWTNTTGNTYTMVVPKITKTNITVANNAVKVDSIFGGAKNAFITNTDPDDGTSITVNGGTAFAVFGGNNFGGNQTAGKHHIEVNNTKSNSTAYPDGLGRNYGIGYVFGGGNKVVGLTTDITITGGMCDTVFAGGNAADVGDAQVVVNCPRTKTFTNAVSTWDEDGNITGINEGYEGYAWNGTGIYNVRALFGGNNRDHMHNLPTITLTRGSVGTVYGGGNAGKMLAQIPDDDDPVNNPGTGPIATDFGSNHIGSAAQPIYYGTHVVMNSANMLVDYLYGGCQMSDVKYSTWVEIQDGHVGTVYGGCNISGDVGSEPRLEYSSTMSGEEYQLVKGGTYVKASGGTVYGNLFAGSNGFYHCNNGVEYISGLNFGTPPYDPDEHYVGDTIPTHNETRVMVSGTAIVKKNVYAGGNMAYVGFINATDQGYRFRDFVGFCSVQMDGGVVEGSVYGGGNRASVFGSNAVQVSGGSIGYIGDELTEGGALYGGNDRAGQVAQITNRVLPASYDWASDGQTNLKTIGVKTYVGITGKPRINTVYGGGNGAYTYTENEYCDVTDKPVQSNTFVDVNINASGGEENGGYINKVYGGGNGVTVLDRITVFVNVENATEENAYDQVGTIFGGNNKGDLDILSDIILLHGQVNTVYGGCNEGAMTGSLSYNGYDNLGSMVHLRSQYQANGTGTLVVPDAKVTGYVYGGCRSNGVTNNTLVLVEGGQHPATFFGGSDISGIVGGTSQVIVTAGSTGDVYGGGNGNYEYTGGVIPPYCNSTHVEALGGTCTNNVFGGGYAGECGETYILVNGGSVTNTVFGGGNQAGVTIVDMNPDPEVTENTTGNSTIVMNGGLVGTGVFGGSNAIGAIDHNVQITFNGGVVGSDEHPADIHGGGYGASTTVEGDVNITFGGFESGNGANEYPKLFGDLYGGSALGSVNSSELNTTTVTILNGTVNGNVYGGGLGDIDDYSKGWVNGVVRVIVGGENADGTYFGKATFNGRLIDGVNKGTSIFGGNNTNGSPQTNVYVDVYQTNHDALNMYNYTGEDRTYAIYQVFGGGNKASYAPENNNEYSEKVTHVYIHGCENTIEEVFGGSNAAHAISTHTVVDGGRFNYIFGGGNGIVSESNVGVYPEIHKTYSQIKGGHVGFCFGGSNRLGTCIYIVQDLETGGNCGELVIDNLFNGGNNADQVGEMELNLTCAEQKNYLTAYGGCRLGTVYGNITVNVTGGIIGTLFGGCQGDDDYAAHVKKYDEYHYPNGHPELIGTGGNITVNVYGGAIGNLYGGCDRNGDVDGKITVKVEDRNTGCNLFVGNVYGGSNATDYEPLVATGISPQVSIIKGTIGGEFDFDGNGSIQENERYEGNVFGGGNYGKVKSNPIVIVGVSSNDKLVDVLGDVYGGGNHGNVEGTSEVIIVPDSHQLTISQNDASAPQYGSNVIRVTDGQGQLVSSGASIDEYANLKLEAIPSVYGGKFNGWTLTGTGAGVANNSLPTTIFTMGTTDASITGTFGTATTHSLTVNTPSHCSITVKDGQGNTVDLSRQISEGAVLQLEVTVETGYLLDSWTVNGGAVVTNVTSTTTSFIMGTADAELSVVIVRAHILTINTPEPSNGGSITVTDVQGQHVSSGTYIRERAVLNLVASHATGFTFGEWTVIGSGSVLEPRSASTTFTMGTTEATLKATFIENVQP